MITRIPEIDTGRMIYHAFRGNADSAMSKRLWIAKCVVKYDIGRNQSNI